MKNVYRTNEDLYFGDLFIEDDASVNSFVQQTRASNLAVSYVLIVYFIKPYFKSHMPWLSDLTVIKNL